MAQPATASPTQPPHYTSITDREAPISNRQHPITQANPSTLALKRPKIKGIQQLLLLVSADSPDCVLVCAAASESWVLQGLSHPVRLRDCRPRHRSLVSGRPREDSCVDVGKSILLATASSESWKSAQIENKQKLESSGLLFSF